MIDMIRGQYEVGIFLIAMAALLEEALRSRQGGPIG